MENGKWNLYTTLTMYCPVCNHKETKVVDSRIHNEGMGIRRRRQCEKCDYRFSTTEELEMLGFTVVKRDGRRVPYEREKMLRGLERSLEKRAYTEASFKKLVHNIERDIQKKRAGEITSAELGEIVMKHLRRFDKIAYIRFASVYQSFEDLEDLDRELGLLMRKRKGKNKHS
ncbi:MAG: Transcriptional repressor NrdR [Candidatus Giovannonibacteria bacterium GW2011_GWA2_53_7]|uniref:Transcriptional repressor NrdR n=1 Tax=Candidatus Giovannonibacteria bacterium GW2011_GWA2_53_7 TaxID=1618650 RepID=A0A0G1XV00_9BACT|nr:MAG: Transcriptional repressor NrdR [Candidatus Giovannonibacteria bacterium GW2011_GWA2_53_7]